MQRHQTPVDRQQRRAIVPIDAAGALNAQVVELGHATDMGHDVKCQVLLGCMMCCQHSSCILHVLAVLLFVCHFGPAAARASARSAAALGTVVAADRSLIHPGHTCSFVLLGEKTVS
jgi:hypothetical protein